VDSPQERVVLAGQEVSKKSLLLKGIYGKVRPLSRCWVGARVFVQGASVPLGAPDTCRVPQCMWHRRTRHARVCCMPSV
jgi:hypothetical protein